MGFTGSDAGHDLQDGAHNSPQFVAAAGENSPRQSAAKVISEGDKPLTIAAAQELPSNVPGDLEDFRPISRTLQEYQKAVKALIGGKCAHLAEVAPAQMRAKCHCWAFIC